MCPVANSKLAWHALHFRFGPAIRLLGLHRQTITIPGVGRLKHGEEFVLDGADAAYVRREFLRIGRLAGDPRDTLEVLSIE